MTIPSELNPDSLINTEIDIRASVAVRGLARRIIDLLYEHKLNEVNPELLFRAEQLIAISIDMEKNEPPKHKLEI